MQTAQGSTLGSLRAVLAFIDTNAAQLGPIPTCGARKSLDATVATLTTHLATQDGSLVSAQMTVKKKGNLRTVLLRDHMAHLARIAAASLPDTPEIAPLKMPKGHPTVERLNALAYGMAQAATPHSAVFVAAGLPDDFIKELTDAADAMVAAASLVKANQGTRGGATQGLKTELSVGRKQVHVLDAMIKTQLADDPALLADWNIVKRVVNTAPGPTAKPATPATAAAPAAPATPVPPKPTAAAAAPSAPSTSAEPAAPSAAPSAAPAPTANPS